MHLQQITDAPEFFAEVDRQLARELGLTEQQIANRLNVSLAGSFQVTPNFWADPKTGIPYPALGANAGISQRLADRAGNTPLFVSGVGRQPRASLVTLFNNVAKLQPAIRADRRQPRQHPADIRRVRQRAGSRPRLGAQARSTRSSQDEQKQAEPPDQIAFRCCGQIADMDSAFYHIGIGLAVAMVAVYLLMAINFQSWGDPFVVLAACRWRSAASSRACSSPRPHSRSRRCSARS